MGLFVREKKERVDNLFNQNPPFFGGYPSIGSFSGYTNGSTLGRMVLLGVKKKF